MDGDGARVEPGPACTRAHRLAFRFDGRRIEGYEGETLGAALHAAGERVLMRSIKYHRPRGLFCNTGKCANCLVRVDGTPNVRACVTPARDGALVETQNAFPSARRDLYAIVDKVYRRNFDYHEMFIRPKSLTRVYHYAIRKMAGFGEVPDARGPTRRPRIAQRSIDVLVVGGGPAGLAAALAAAEGGASVLLAEESDRLGGSLLLQGQLDRADALERRLADARVETLVRTVAFGLYLTDGVGDALPPPGVVALLAPERVVEVRAKAIVVAAGYHETPPLFPGNDLPGVMGARAALILLHRHGVLAGTRAVVLSSAGLGRRAAEDLAKAGVDVAGIVGEGAWKGARVVRAQGSSSVERVELEQDGRVFEERCDLVVAAGDETPRVELLQQAGARLAPLGAALAAASTSDVAGVFAAGEVFGASSPEDALASGARAGAAAASAARGRDAS